VFKGLSAIYCEVCTSAATLSNLMVQEVQAEHEARLPMSTNAHGNVLTAPKSEATTPEAQVLRQFSATKSNHNASP
jgi:hypothetical protein